MSEGGAASATRSVLLDAERRLAHLRAVVCLGALAGLLMSGSLWLTSRFLPLHPVIPGFPTTPFPLDVALFAVACIALGLAAFAKRPLVPSVVALAILGFLLLQDQARLFPSTYELAFLLLLLTVNAFSRDGSPESPLRTARLVVAFIYIWSGIQKFAPAFSGRVLPELFSSAWTYLAGSSAVVTALALAIPLFEIGVGSGLLTRSYRRHALVAALMMHAFLIVAIGPFHDPWMRVAWTWNLTTAVLVFVLFGQVSPDPPPFPKDRMRLAAIALFGVVPALNLFGAWDSALAFNAYSGNVTDGAYVVSDALAARLPVRARAHVRQEEDGRLVFDAHALAFDETHAGLYAEPRIYRGILRKLCAYAQRPDDAVLTIRRRTGLLGTPPPETRDCSDP